MTRRALLLAAAAQSLAHTKAPISQISVEGYIFQQYAETRKTSLSGVIDEVLPMARAAGFSNIELNNSFFVPELRPRVLSLLRAQRLAMPSVYVGGALHNKDSAERTIARAVETCDICAPFGCTAVVNNPDPKPGDVPKTDTELVTEAEALNTMGQTLARHGFQLRVHHHTPQLENNAREWRFILQHTDPAFVHICVDVDWAYEGGFNPVSFLAEVGKRLREIHVRSARSKVWLEDVQDSDIDYRQVAAFLKSQQLHPLIAVELAYRPTTTITRSLLEDLRRSRVYTEKVFGLTGMSQESDK